MVCHMPTGNNRFVKFRAMISCCALAITTIASRAPMHRVMNVSFYPSYDSVGVPISGDRLLFAGGKGTNRSAVTYDAANRQFVRSGTICADRASMAGTSTPDGTVALFGGGEGVGKVKFSAVDLYDATQNTWICANSLSEARSFLAATTVVDPTTRHVFSLFGGGEIVAGVTGSDSARVDVFDHQTQTWSVSTDLSHPRKKLAAASALGVAVFGGGYTSGEKNMSTRGYQSAVDIWNSTSKVWSTASLSQPRQYIVAAATKEQVLFGGGFCSPCIGQNGTDRSNVVDIFDVKSNTWTSHILAQRRSNLAACSVGGRYVLFGGGTTDVNGSFVGITRSDVVDIYDGKSGTWSVALLSEGRCCLGAAGGHRTAVFLGGGDGTSADIYEFA